MRKLTQNQVCPVCRANLPPGPKRAFEEAVRRYLVVDRRLAREDRAWTSLSKKERDEMKVVIELWRGAASEGYADAQFSLGMIFVTGRGGVKNEVEAAKWLRKAAEQGLADAQYNLGVAFTTGQGVAKNEVEAVKWYRKAAEQGFAKAHGALRQLGTSQEAGWKPFTPPTAPSFLLWVCWPTAVRSLGSPFRAALNSPFGSPPPNTPAKPR